MNSEVAKEVVLERLVPELQSEGYDVFVRPSRRMLPLDFGSYVPDVVALRNDKKLAIEIQHNGDRSNSMPRELAKRLEELGDWEFRVVWVNPRETLEKLQLQSPAAITERLKEISGLLDAGFVDAAMLMCWAALEAIARKLTSGEFSRPQTTGRLVQVLASEGHITPDEADSLRQMADVRNRFVHGELTSAASRSDVEAFMRILSSLANDAQATPAN
jgi:uncharacterized protein YutE (UPF0331/DUF86 family)